MATVEIFSLKTMEQESAVSQALRIPHILEVIFRFLKDGAVWDPCTPLRACTLVNSSWEPEANRVLWENCEDRHVFKNYPQVHYLRSIDPKRRQKYANYIRKITISSYAIGHQDGEWSCYCRLNHNLEWNRRYLAEISQLSFPRLESLTIPTPGANQICCYAVPLRQLISPKLRKLGLIFARSHHYIISEEFLDRLEKFGTLRDIHIELDDDHQMFVDKREGLLNRLASFFKNLQYLERVCRRLSSSMSREAIEVLAPSSYLKTAILPLIQDSWVENLPICAFPVLEKFECRLFSRALQALLPFFKLIKDFTLYETDESPTMFATVVQAGFAYLNSLDLLLHLNTIIYGEDIMSIVRCSPQLQNLTIKASVDFSRRDLLIAKDFGDSRITELAKSLPKLTRLDLGCCSETEELGENSLVSLGRYCPLLKQCRLVARVNWETFLRGPYSHMIWPNLDYLDLDCFHRPYSDEAAEPEGLDELLRAFLRYMPTMATESSARFYELGRKSHISDAFAEFRERRYWQARERETTAYPIQHPNEQSEKETLIADDAMDEESNPWPPCMWVRL